MSLIRDLHPHVELDRYDVIPSWGNYLTVIEGPPVLGLPDHSALTRAAYQEARLIQQQNLRKRRGQKTGRRL